MGNCQAVDATALVIQHPSGKLERWYWQITVSEVMSKNPGHYVSVIIPAVPVSTTTSSSTEEEKKRKNSVRYTRVKLLQPTDTLVLGQAYRLVTTQEVMKVVQAKKKAMMKNKEQEFVQRRCHEGQKFGRERHTRKLDRAAESNQETDQVKAVQMKPPAVGRTKSWKPSLQSISEAGS